MLDLRFKLENVQQDNVFKDTKIKEREDKIKSLEHELVELKKVN